MYFLNLFQLFHVQQFDLTFIYKWSFGIGIVPFDVDLLHSYFMSAKDEEEKIKRLKDFLLGTSYFVIFEITLTAYKLFEHSYIITF